MNSYVERTLIRALVENQGDKERQAAEQLLTWAKDGLYDMGRPLSREEAHIRHA